jgi:hypothetical protein
MRLLLIFCIFALSVYTEASAAEITTKDGKKEIPVCGGFAGLTCSDKQYCDYPPHSSCGIADQFGTCKPRPEFCPEIYMPVCGCNGHTYPNACQAAHSGQSVAHAGSCNPDPSKK